jgi:hypothetical protein
MPVVMRCLRPSARACAPAAVPCVQSGDRGHRASASRAMKGDLYSGARRWAQHAWFGLGLTTVKRHGGSRASSGNGQPTSHRGCPRQWQPASAWVNVGCGDACPSDEMEGRCAQHLAPAHIVGVGFPPLERRITDKCRACGVVVSACLCKRRYPADGALSNAITQKPTCSNDCGQHARCRFVNVPHTLNTGYRCISESTAAGNCSL